MAEKVANKYVVASKFREVNYRVGSAPAVRTDAKSSDQKSQDKACKTREPTRTELPKGVNSVAAYRNKQKHESGVIGDLLNEASRGEALHQETRCSSKAQQENRVKHTNSEMAKVMDSNQACNLPVPKPRLQGKEANRNREFHSGSKINFVDMYSEVEKPDSKPKLGPSPDCARNYQKNALSEGMSNSLNHDYTRELTPPRPPRVTCGGIKNAARMQGSELNAVMHSQHLEFERPKPKLGPSPAAQATYEMHRGSGEVWIRGEHEGDEPPAPRVKYGGQTIASKANGSAAQRTLKYGVDPEPYEAPPVRVTSQAARKNYDKSVNTVMKGIVFSDYRNAPLDEKPVPKTRSALATELRNHQTKGVTHILFHQYGKLDIDPKPSPTLRAGAYGNYRRQQGDSIRALIHREAFHGPPRRMRRRRPRSALN